MNEQIKYKKDILEQLYKIDFEHDNIITIGEIKIPNFYKDKISFIYNIDDYQRFEFLHSLYKIYNNYAVTNLSYYENEQIFIESDDIVFDCGGNMGLFSAYAASKGTKIYSFEPLSLNRKYLSKTSTFYNNVVIVPFGLGNKNYIDKFYQCDNIAASHSTNILLNQKNVNLYTEQVRIISLDSFIGKYHIFPNFIKADIEGAEMLLLEGGHNYIVNYKPKLAISFHSNNIDEVNYIKLKYNDIYNFIIKDELETEDIILLGERKND